MEQKIEAATPQERVFHHARVWRRSDQEALADKQNREKQRAEYQARKKLRKTVDEAGEP